VRTECVPFRCAARATRGMPALVYGGSSVRFGVRIVLSRVADGFALAWEPVCLQPGILQEELDYFEVQLLGSVVSDVPSSSIPMLPIASYCGALTSREEPSTVDIGLHQPGILPLEIARRGEPLVCALRMLFFTVGEEETVHPTISAPDPKAPLAHRGSPSSFRLFTTCAAEQVDRPAALNEPFRSLPPSIAEIEAMLEDSREASGGSACHPQVLETILGEGGAAGSGSGAS